MEAAGERRMGQGEGNRCGLPNREGSGAGDTDGAKGTTNPATRGGGQTNKSQRYARDVYSSDRIGKMSRICPCLSGKERKKVKF